MKKTYLTMVLIFLCASTSVGQLRYTFTQFGNESIDFIKQPAKWDGDDWLKLGLIGVATVLVLETADQPIRDIALRNPQYNKSVPIEAGRMWGDLSTPIILFSGFAVHSLITDDLRTRKIAYEIGQASLYGGALTYLLKLVIGRSRPYMNEGNTSFHPFSTLISDDTRSFPGGHNAVAAILSTVLSRNAGPTWLKVVAYIPAALTFISRIYQDKHWASDNVMGQALGFFIATWVVDQHEKPGSTSAVGINSVYPLSISITF